MSDLPGKETLPSDPRELSGPAVSKISVDPLATLIVEREPPSDYHVDDLLVMWRGAQRETTNAYTMWREDRAAAGYATYVAALDREERAAEVYANVRGRMVDWNP